MDIGHTSCAVGPFFEPPSREIARDFIPGKISPRTALPMERILDLL